MSGSRGGRGGGGGRGRGEGGGGGGRGEGGIKDTIWVLLQVPESIVFVLFSAFLWLGLVWSCFVFCLLFLLFYVICAPVLTEGTHNPVSVSALIYQQNFISFKL